MISAIGGTLPLALATGAGAESRTPLGSGDRWRDGHGHRANPVVVPVFQLLFGWLVQKVTGHSSAQGLLRASKVEEEVKEAG